MENLNRTRLECKVNSSVSKSKAHSHLNRTRLECKVRRGVQRVLGIYIWIEPDWNVKKYGTPKHWHLNNIWIEPDWNVKINRFLKEENKGFIWIEPDWNVKRDAIKVKNKVTSYLNRTRLECKVVLSPSLSSNCVIWIEPDWNVKWPSLPSILPFHSFE